MSFTPGPYLFEKQHCGKNLVLAERPNKCPIEVAECFSEPNARLFAAAPELRDRLAEITRKFLRELAEWSSTGKFNPKGELLDSINKGWDLIFRIEGGE